MVPSANSRKPFSLNVYIPPLARSLSKDSAAAHSDRSYTPNSSRVSLLSPRSPLFPASLHLKQEQPVIPIPLTDGLDPSEKMKLLRKSRKVSRILGEVPILVPVSSPSTAASDYGFPGGLEEPSFSSASTSASSSPAKFPPPGVGKLATLKRSVTVGHNRQAQQGDIHRARSLASLRPSLTIPPGAITVHHSPISPIVFAWPENNPIPPSPLSPVASENDSASGRSLAKRDSTVSSKRDSVASSIFPSERSPEQILRARAAKLARQLGDNIPPDVLLRAASPPPPRSPLASPSAVSFAEASLTLREPPRRTASVRPPRDDRRDLKRPLSLDIRTFVRVADGAVPSATGRDAGRLGTISRAHKGAAPRPRTSGDVDGKAAGLDEERESDLGSDWEDDFPGVRSLERQRALNVRRARKMLQVFGNEPPPSLFQITNIPPSATDDDISVADATHRRSESLATAFSVPASTLSATGTHEHRESVATLSSSGDSNLSPLIFRNPASAPPSHPATPQPGLAYDDDDDDEEETAPTLPPKDVFENEVHPLSPLSVPSLASSSVHSLSTSTISLSASHAPPTKLEVRAPLTSPIRSSFQLSPPADRPMFWGPQSAPATAPPSPPLSPMSPPPTVGDAHPSDPHFRVRRIRAAKLSRFFGVGLNDIAGMLRTGNGTGTGSAPSSPPADASSFGAAGAPGPGPAPSSPPPPSRPQAPSLREFRRSSTDTIPSPVSTTGSTRAPGPLRQTRSARPVTSAGILSTTPVVPLQRQRTQSTGRRSQSVSRGARRPQTQGAVSTSPSAFADPAAAHRDRSHSQPEVLAHNRAFSTTVEVATEGKRPFAFFDGRRQGRGKELHMNDVIRELRKIK
ncbi:hypothetical protein C2E23DRAFT_899459 [Lenzites betulinus]|nr:hypothetical protein C2E23DRAFT_899459 [Lenzites betulinus]